VLKLGATSATGVYPNAFGLIASTRDIVFGLAVIFFLMYEPLGLARIWLRIKSYWTLWPYSYSAAHRREGHRPNLTEGGSYEPYVRLARPAPRVRLLRREY
jgi:hypothetical protein